MKHLHRFFSSDASGGIILIIAAALAMLMANMGATSGWYHDFLETPVQLRVGALEINKKHAVVDQRCADGRVFSC